MTATMKMQMNITPAVAAAEDERLDKCDADNKCAYQPARHNRATEIHPKSYV
jgi:hypothetical protein